MEPQFLIALQPTRGLDVGAIEYVHRCLPDQRQKGTAILLISTELEDIFTLSDRIAIIYQGKIMGIIPNHDVDIEQLGLMMAGSLDLSAKAEN